MHTYEASSLRTLEVYLRHKPNADRRFHAPAEIWLGAEGTTGDALLQASDAFLVFATSIPGVLFGGITFVDNLAQAWSEVTGTATDIEKQSAAFQARHAHDWRLYLDTWTLCRRLYWKTLLGPTLAAAAGGASAARAAGALDLRELGGSLLFQAMPGPPRDSLDPEFLAATTSLRRWLWPHTFKNPLDAAGFEAEVGLPSAAPA